MLKRFAIKSSRVSKKVAAGVVVVGATASQAAVTYTEGAGFAGSIDMTAYNSAIPIVITVMGILIATGVGIKVFKKI